MLDLIIPAWPSPARVRAYQTTRRGGVSQGSYASLNLGAHVGDEQEAVSENRRLVKESLRFPSEPRWLNQVHGIRVTDVGSYDGVTGADAGIGTAPGLVVAIMTGDCLPVLFCDEAGTIVAGAHGGWRGLCAGVLEETVRFMERDPSTLMAWMGPAIGPASYEVGDEVRKAFVDTAPASKPYFVPTPGGRWLADLYGLARGRLEAAGVTRVYGGGYCTFGESQRFFSYRRDRQTGRMGTFIWLEPRVADPRDGSEGPE